MSSLFHGLPLNNHSALSILLLGSLWVSAPADARWDEEKQAELDAACEVAREKKLAPLRAQHIEECVEQGHQRDRESCERFYADFGAQSGQRAPLFYDLPECQKAFDYAQSSRSR